MKILLALLALATSACARPQPAGPTPVPEPPSVRPLAGRGIQVDGHGTTQTDDITPQYAGGLTIGIEVVTLSHDGRSSFIVTAVQGGQSELVTSAAPRMDFRMASLVTFFLFSLFSGVTDLT